MLTFYHCFDWPQLVQGLRLTASRWDRNHHDVACAKNVATQHQLIAFMLPPIRIWLVHHASCYACKVSDMINSVHYLVWTDPVFSDTFGSNNEYFLRPRRILFTFPRVLSTFMVQKGKLWLRGLRVDVVIPRNQVRTPPKHADFSDHRRVPEDYSHAAPIFSQLQLHRIRSRVASGSSMDQARLIYHCSHCNSIAWRMMH